MRGCRDRASARGSPTVSGRRIRLCRGSSRCARAVIQFRNRRTGRADSCPEFTSLCPLTGQPDFAHIVIDYVPNKKILESKSLKLFLGSFRNHGDFHEACTIYIAKRIIKEVKPHWLRIGGYWYPRGGIPIDVFYQTGKPPEGVFIPEQGVENYKGR